MKMSKIGRKSKVSVNDVVSSEEEIVSEEDPTKEDFDDNNNNEMEELDSDLEDSDSAAMAANSGWADAISKVLAVKTRTKNKSLILLKAKKDKDSKRKADDKNDSLEIVKSDGTVVNSSDIVSKKLKPNETVPKKHKKLSKHEWEVMNKLKPKDEEKDRERQLCSVATKGVVQLFNAVKEQQKTIETKIKEVGVSETKRDKMLSQFNKNQFLDKLKQMDKSKKDNKNNNQEDDQQKGEKKWKVLRDDFMIGAKMKDWDKQSDSDEESND